MINACTVAKSTHGTIPEQGLKVNEIYKRSQNKPIKQFPRHHKPLLKKVHRKFKALPNPEVPIYVYEHVANIGGEQIIKPSYTTRFFLYSKNHFALPSEIY